MQLNYCTMLQYHILLLVGSIDWKGKSLNI